MQKENSKKIILWAMGIVVLVIVFYGGMAYGKNQTPTRGNQSFGQNFRNDIGG